jgi:hypothetical protein
MSSLNLRDMSGGHLTCTTCQFYVRLDAFLTHSCDR